MDNVSAFNVFVQVAETRSFVAAGRVLGLTASAVGKSIARLEARLGVRLFHRSTRSVILTAEGALFLERCRRILTEIDQAEAELTQTRLEPRGRLRVSLPLVGDPFLPILAQFSLANPQVDLDLDFSDRRVNLIDEGFDAVIRTGESEDSRLTARQLGKFRVQLVGSPQYFAQRGIPRHPNDLADHSCIQFRFPNTGKLQVWPLRGAGADPGLLLPTSMVCNNLQARIAFAVEGAGIAYLPDFAIADMLADGRLVTVLEDCSETDTYRILWPSEGHPAPKLRAFIDFLAANLFPARQVNRGI